MTVRVRSVSGTGLSANSTALRCPSGKCAIQIKSASGLTAGIHYSLDDGTTYDQDKDATSITADGLYSSEVPTDSLVRIQVTAGSCSYEIKTE